MRYFIIFLFSVLCIPSIASAQMMGGYAEEYDDGHTAREEAEGMVIYERLERGELACADLSDADFGALGEYYMGLMTGDSHAAMNTMMIQMMGEEGEEQVHVVMGQRLSGCNVDAVYPAAGFGYMPMMNMMGGWGGFGPNGWRDGMMGGSWGWLGGLGFLGLFFMLAFWVGVIALVVWIVKLIFGTVGKGKSAREILDHRYARGEIDKETYEQMKKDLGR